MHVKALLDVDMVAMEATDNVTLMLDLTAPANPKHASRPGQAVQVVLDRSGSMEGEPLEAAKGLKTINDLGRRSGGTPNPSDSMEETTAR